MSPDLFIQKFDRFLDAPDAVTKLRGLILELAIRGALVPQDAGDEPASALLKRVQSNSSEFAKRTRKQPALPAVDDDTYMPIPLGWAWTRLGNTGRIFNGDSVSEIGKTELAQVKVGLPFIATKDVGYGRTKLIYDNGLKVPLNDARFKVAKANAVLICAEGGSAGRKIGITDRDICFGNKLYANEVNECLNHRYIFYVYQSPTFFRQFAAKMTGIIGGISRSDFLFLPVPIPPLAEQKRIVAKVDELMALCDQLEAQLADQSDRQAALARAALERFAANPSPAELELLFHPAVAIPPADLRKSILTLAFQGDLTICDAKKSSIHAEEVLNDAAEARRKYWSNRHGLKRKYPDPEPFKSKDLPRIPNHWLWASIDAVSAQVTDGEHIQPPYQSEGVPMLSAKHVRDGYVTLDAAGLISEEAFQKSIERCKPENGDILIVSVGATTGRSAIVTNCPRFAIVRSVLLLKPIVMREYLHWWLKNPWAFTWMTQASGASAQPHLYIRDLKRMPVPIPPLAEQRRIVAKVDELMAIVDRLEACQSAARDAGTRLLDAAVAELTCA